MKRALLCCCGLGLLAVQLGAAPADLPKKAKLFVLSGQSNAGGSGIGSELPAELKTTDDTVVQFGRHVRGLVPLAPHKRNGYGADNTAFGPELAFAKEMKKRYPDYVICVAKQTIGGCSIIAWDKNWKRAGWLDELKAVDNEEKGPQYDKVMDVAHGAVAALEEKGVTDIEFAGMLWVQSERDDHSEATAKAYEANLRALIKNVRSDWHAPEMPFLLADANGHRFVEVISAGMHKVAADTPRTAVIAIAGLPKHKAVHYNTQGQIMLGQRFAEAYLKMVDGASAKGAPAPINSPQASRK